MNWQKYSHYYLVGIKGVAMTSLTQILLDAGKTVRGSDTTESFVTQDILNALQIQIDSFEAVIPSQTDCVIYTAAHTGQFNPQVIAAQAQNIPCFSQAEAVAAFFNTKRGIAVCGVGGKSTTSAMITWILEKTNHTPSFSVGVGKIIGLERTGRWSEQSEFFVAEADEYVTDPTALSRGEPITPRFSYMYPFITVCTNFAFDHPDVYSSIADTKQAYQNFFNQISPAGALLLNDRDRGVVPVSTTAQKIYYFGESEAADFGIVANSVVYQAGSTKATFFDRSLATVGENGSYLDQTVEDAAQNPTPQPEIFQYELTLQIPGMYNLENAAYAIFAAKFTGVPVAESCQALASFQSTKRRFERIGEKNGVLYFDDYAHHPSEVKNVIAAIKLWYPNQRIVTAFQSHTFSRTKQLFDQFIEALGQAQEVVLIDIFASAREAYDDSITSDMLVSAVQAKYPQTQITNVKTIENLAQYLQSTLRPGDICLTIGAGDIYKVHDLLN